MLAITIVEDTPSNAAVLKGKTGMSRNSRHRIPLSVETSYQPSQQDQLIAPRTGKVSQGIILITRIRGDDDVAIDDWAKSGE